MDAPGVDDVSYVLGVRLRRARSRLVMTQAEVAAISGVSQPMISRMELGRGSASPLASWVAVSVAIGIDLLARPDTEPAFGRAAILTLANEGGWTPFAFDASTVTIHRPPRRVPGLEHPRVVAGERAAVLVVDVLTDLEQIIAFAHTTERVAMRDAPDGWSVGTLVVVRRTTSNQRRLSESLASAREAYPDSGSAWIGALRSPTSTMPKRSGLVWVDAHGTRLLPTGLRLRYPRRRR